MVRTGEGASLEWMRGNDLDYGERSWGRPEKTTLHRYGVYWCWGVCGVIVWFLLVSGKYAENEYQRYIKEHWDSEKAK